jgi:flagellin-like hook-associated protein FlgL
MTGLGALNLNLFGSSGQLPSRAPIQEIDLSGMLTPAAPVDVAPRATPARLPPWDQNAPKTPTDQLVRSALNSRFLVETSLGSGAGSGVTDRNDRELFILHNAVNKLRALAERASSSGLSAPDRARFTERIERGLKEVTQRAASTQLEGAIMLSGKRLINHTSETLERTRTTFDTRVLATGPTGTVPESFLGDRRFSIAVVREGVTTTVAIDLAELGTEPRTMQAVTGLINTKLAAEGLESRVTAVESTRKGATATAPSVTEHRLRVTIATAERVSFVEAPGDVVPSLTVAGARAVNGVQQSAVVRLDAPSGTTATAGFDQVISASGTALGPAGSVPSATVRSMVRDGDGNTFVIADATGKVGAVTPKSARDVVLQKIDSTGAVVWTRALGSAAAAQGFSLALGPQGQLAVAGSVDGLADRARTTTGSGRDSFVAVFDSAGRDMWFHQQGAARADQADHVAFGADGSVFIQGRTQAGMAGVQAEGDADIYVQAFSPAGALSWTRVIGEAGIEEPAGLVINDGVPVIGWNSPAGARLQVLDPTDGSNLASGLDTASLDITRITALQLSSDGRLVLAGQGQNTEADQIRVMDPATGGLLMSASTNGQSIRSLAVGEGQVVVALGAPPAASGSGLDATRTMVQGLSLDDGSQTFATTAAVAASGPVSLALDAGQSRSLFSMGLPQGELNFGDAERLTDRTGLRAGDHFFVKVNDRREERIEIAEGETFRSLAAKVNRALLRDGRAEARSIRGQDSLVITPSAGDRVQLRAGASGQDVLRQLGLEPGVAMPRTSTTGTRSVSDPPPVIALDIPARGDISSVAAAKSLMDGLDGVLRRIRLGYREISTDPTQVELRRTTSQGRPSAAAQASIAAYNKQTAAAQDALRRLGGGF